MMRRASTPTPLLLFRLPRAPERLSSRLSGHGVLPRPLPRGLLVPLPVGLVDVGNPGHERIVWVWVREEGADAEQDLADGQGRAPLLLQDV